MKVNFKKIILIITVTAIALVTLNISAYADTSYGGIEHGGGSSGGNRDEMTPHNYLISMSQIIDDYANGNITFDEFNSQSDSLVDRYTADNATFDSEATKKVYALINATTALKEKAKVVVIDELKDIWDSLTQNVPTETTQTSTTDLEGYGALIVQEYSQGNSYKLYFYCDYAVLFETEGLQNGNVFAELYSDTSIYLVRYVNGSFFDKNNFQNHYFLREQSSLCVYHCYGDIRYADGTPAPTDDEYEYGTIKNFDEMPERELNDLINDLIEALENLNPDLSSIEGLLKSIYYRLGTLDKDDDNKLLSEILVAIKSLKNNETDNTELLGLLEEIRDSLVYNGGEEGENKESYSEQLKTIIENQITADDFDIDMEMYNNQGEILKERLLGKFSFIHNMKLFVTNCFEHYKNTEEVPEFEITYNGHSYKINFNAFSEYMSTIQWILAAFVYITYAYHTYRKIPSYINGGDNE
ncbi:MAG: hypothetical protein NC253_01500 [Ruminococcus sp.]|nr:hypothetical protein [Ruminococcus sp.]MCM1381160.1 hypothetical protein [Muribaculaceae bacterium]MCM1479651.1 hypothetical protein [Muribaculaceae bacterium]